MLLISSSFCYKGHVFSVIHYLPIDFIDHPQRWLYVFVSRAYIEWEVLLRFDCRSCAPFERFSWPVSYLHSRLC
jgi:hypothetical protein